MTTSTQTPSAQKTTSLDGQAPPTCSVRELTPVHRGRALRHLPTPVAPASKSAGGRHSYRDRTRSERRVHYLSMEFLMGRALGNAGGAG